MSDTPRESAPSDHSTSDFTADHPDYDSTAEPVTGAPAGAAATEPAAVTTDSGAAHAEGAPDSGAAHADAAPDSGAAHAEGEPATRPARRMLNFGPVADAPPDARQSRRRRWFQIGISIAAAITLLALCAGAISVFSAINGVRDRAADARDTRALRETDCRDLETRLNRLLPPGATITAAARATAIRDENAAVRLYVEQLRGQREEDAWRQLLDARTVFADALDREAKSRTPAFYVAPRTGDGLAVADQLEGWSAAPCAGPIHRLAAPEL